MACRPYNTGRCLQLRLFNCPNFGVHFSTSPRVRYKLLEIHSVKNGSSISYRLEYITYPSFCNRFNAL